MRDEEMRLLRLAARRADRAREEAEAETVYVSISDFMKMARCSRNTIDRLRKRRPEGFPTEHNRWGRPRFKRQEVEDWLQGQPLW